MDASPSQANRQIARAAGTVMAAFVLSNLVGLLRNILVTDAFGTGLAIEAFAAANRVSETLFVLIAGGALGSSFIPPFAALLARQERAEAWKLASAIANLMLVVLTGLAALAALLAPLIVRYLLAPGFAADPEKFDLTVSLLRLMLPSAVIFGLSGLVMAILNSHQVFLIPALAPSMYSLGMIAGVLFLKPGYGITGLALGVLIGATLHLGLQIPTLIRLKGRYFPTFGLRLPGVREVARLMGPRLFGAAIVQLNFWVNTLIASFLPEGSLNGINYAWGLMLMPQVAIAQSIATAAMPTFATQAALGKLSEMRASLAATLRGVLFLAIPASLGLLILRRPVVALLYEHGEFTPESTTLVAWALLWYAAGLVGHCVVEIMARAFYALHDTRTPVLVGAAAMTLNILFSVAFTRLFEMAGWMPHGGLALANSLATALEMAALLVLMRRRLGGLGAAVGSGALRSLISGLGMAAGLLVWLALMDGRANWMVAGGGIGLGGGIYLALMLLLARRQMAESIAWIRRRQVS